MSDEQLATPTDLKSLHCIDCGGFPIDEGAVFVAVFLVRDGKPELGGMCEYCWLKRLERRGQVINATSSPSAQVEVPALGLHREKRRRK